MKTSRAALGVLAAVALLVSTLAFAILRVGGTVSAGPAYSGPVQPAPSTGSAPAVRAVGASRSAARPVVDPAWAARVAARAGIPAPALRAYADAQLVLSGEDPGCHLGWNTLAGLGWVESQHGTIGGRTLRTDGRSSRPVLGPALDGSGSYAAIHATPDSTAWHGDAVWDHAVGPLQFLASTWARWGTDADGDGRADPLDLDDAALAAGRYLCADGHDLATDTGWSAAVHSYNHSDAYVVAVAAAANSYTQRAR